MLRYISFKSFGDSFNCVYVKVSSDVPHAHRGLPMVIIMILFGTFGGMYVIVANADACSCWCYPVSVGNVLPHAVPRDWVGYSFNYSPYTCTHVHLSSIVPSFVPCGY